MAFERRYESTYFSLNGTAYYLEIRDQNWASGIVAKEADLGVGGCSIHYDMEGEQKYSPIIASKMDIPFLVKDGTDAVFIKNLIEDYNEGDVVVALYKGSSATYKPIWAGYLLMDLGAQQDVSYPYEVKITATDGLARLKDIGFWSDEANQITYAHKGHERITYWLGEILNKLTPPGTTQGISQDAIIRAAVNWYNEEHQSAGTTFGPLYQTQIKMGMMEDLDTAGNASVRNCYEVLKDLCTTLGMRCIYWKHSFYFVQLDGYNTAESGTLINPTNINTRDYSLADPPVHTASRDYLGDSWYARYNQNIENQTTPGKGIQKLAGTTYQNYPVLKRVSADFITANDQNYYRGFPESTPFYTGITTFDIVTVVQQEMNDPQSATKLLLRVPLTFQQDTSVASYNQIYDNYTVKFYCYIKATVPTSATGTGTDPQYLKYSGGSYSWTTTLPTWGEFILLQSPLLTAADTGVQILTPFTNSGTPGELPPLTGVTGTWQLEIILQVYQATGSLKDPVKVYAGTTGTSANGYDYNIHGVKWANALDPTFGLMTPYTTTLATGITQQFHMLSAGNPFLGDLFLLNSSLSVGSMGTKIITETNENDTSQLFLGQMFWGDSPMDSDPSSIKVWDGAAWEFTDPTGEWGIGTITPASPTSLTKLLLKEYLDGQSFHVYKMNARITLSVHEKNSIDASGQRPKYVNPIGRINDVDGKSYIFLRGTFTTGDDTWDGEWFNIGRGTPTLTTTTQSIYSLNTPATASTLPMPAMGGGNGNAGARLGAPFGITTTRARIAAGDITSIPILDIGETLLADNDRITLVDSNSGQVYALRLNAAQTSGDTTLTIDAYAFTEDVEAGAFISINSKNLIQQYQNKTEGTLNLSQYSFTERSTDPYFPATGSAVMWMSDGTASGDDGDMLITINTGAALTTSKFDLTAIAADPFTFTVDTTASGSASDTFVLPLVDDGTISILVNWGDGNSDIITTYNQSEITHQYSAGGTYSVTMQGTIRGFRFADAGDKAKMRVISQWGDLNITQSMAFNGCIDMTCTASDAPTILDNTDLNRTFYNCTDLTGIGGAWNMSAVTSLDSFFYQCSVFNQDISAWNVSSVTNFDELFFLNVLFNQDISGWNTSAATTMVDMLDGNPSGAFNQDISSWDIADVTDFGTNFMREQTLSTANYDALLIAWDGQSVQSGLTLDFGNSQYTSGGTAATARANLISSDSWTISDGGAVIVVVPFTFTVNTANAGSASDTFVLPLVNDGVIEIDVDWGDSSTDTITAYNQAEVTHTYAASGTYTVQMEGTIRGFKFGGSGDKAKILNISKWGDLNITQCCTFQGCTNLTSNATDAPSIGTTNLTYMFFQCSNFNQDIDNWDVSSVTQMDAMFNQATSFNQDLNSWNTAEVLDMQYLFSGASAFTGNISSWNVSKVQNFTQTFYQSAFNSNISSWNTGACTNTYGMFRGNTTFNQDISAWNMGSVSQMGVMFDGTTAFNQDIGGWNVSSLTNVWGMLRNATSFDQDLGNWDVSNITTMSNFLQGATLSTANYDATLIGWDDQSVQAGQTPNFGSSTYTAGGDAEAARAALISEDGWTITDGGPAE